MPSKKPIVQTVVDNEIYTKFKALCKRDERSESKLAALIIKKYIEEYEKIHGEIILPDEDREEKQ